MGDRIGDRIGDFWGHSDESVAATVATPSLRSADLSRRWQHKRSVLTLPSQYISTLSDAGSLSALATATAIVAIVTVTSTCMGSLHNPSTTSRMLRGRLAYQQGGVIKM